MSRRRNNLLSAHTICTGDFARPPAINDTNYLHANPNRSVFALLSLSSHSWLLSFQMVNDISICADFVRIQAYTFTQASSCFKFNWFVRFLFYTLTKLTAAAIQQWIDPIIYDIKLYDDEERPHCMAYTMCFTDSYRVSSKMNHINQACGLQLTSLFRPISTNNNTNVYFWHVAAA